MRILVCGSRDWKDAGSIRAAIFDQVNTWSYDGDIELIHGDCPTGADSMVKAIAVEQEPHYKVTPYPANWGKYGKPAGPIRNQAMVDSKPDLCLAFTKSLLRPDGRTTGTFDCVQRCVLAGIEVRIFSR